MRFAVLQHFPPRQEAHFDLLFEDESGSLRTWRCERAPDACWQPIEPLGLHRAVYLGYQGPIVGRGWVRRVERGSYRVMADLADVVRAIVRTPRGSALLEIENSKHLGAGWRCRRTGLAP